MRLKIERRWRGTAACGEWVHMKSTDELNTEAAQDTLRLLQSGGVGSSMTLVDCSSGFDYRYTLIPDAVKRKVIRFTSPRNGGESCDYRFPMTTHIEDAGINVTAFFTPPAIYVGDALTIENKGVVTRYELVEVEDES